MSARQNSNTSQRSNHSASKKTAGTHSRHSSGFNNAKYASAEKRKMVCSLPRHNSNREQASAAKPAYLKLFNQNSSSKKSQERMSYAASVGDEPSTQIPASFSQQKLVNPGMNMLKTQSQSITKSTHSKTLSSADVLASTQKSGYMQKSVMEHKKAVLDQRFELIRKIDEGTYAKVYYAHDWKYEGREVVVKLLRSRAMSSSSEREQVKCEMRNHDALNHENIIQMLGGNMKGEMYIWGQK